MILKEIALWALRKRRPWRVHGVSMEPEFQTGDLVLINPDAPVVVGAAVVALHPFKNIELIKYVKSIDGDLVFLESPAGDDSHQFGRIPVHTIRGIVTHNWKARRNR